MKIAKKFFYAIMILCMLLCVIVLACALIPGLSDKAAIALYGENQSGEESQTQEEVLIYPNYTISSSTTAGLNCPSTA